MKVNILIVKKLKVNCKSSKQEQSNGKLEH